MLVGCAEVGGRCCATGSPVSPSGGRWAGGLGAARGHAKPRCNDTPTDTTAPNKLSNQGQHQPAHHAPSYRPPCQHLLPNHTSLAASWRVMTTSRRQRMQTHGRRLRRCTTESSAGTCTRVCLMRGRSHPVRHLITVTSCAALPHQHMRSPLCRYATALWRVRADCAQHWQLVYHTSTPGTHVRNVSIA